MRAVWITRAGGPEVLAVRESGGGLREELAALLDLWRAGAIRPRIDGVYPFAEAAAAHRRIGDRRNIGKVIVMP